MSTDIAPLRPYRCPFCGSDDVVYQQPSYAVHPLIGVTDNGYLLIEDGWNIDMDMCQPPNLLCRACGEPSSVPSYLKEEFR